MFGGAIYTNNSTFEFNNFSTGGGIYAARSVLNFLGGSSVTANRAARDGGGMYTRDDRVVNLLGLSLYQNNSAGDTGGGISAFQSSFNLVGQISCHGNKAVEGGGFYTFKSTVNVPGESTFITNSASNHGGGITVIHGTLHLSGWTTFKNNSAASGGGMYISDSKVDSDGSNCFINNTARSEGGGIDARDSVVKFNGNGMFVANSARTKGAAIHLSFTTLIFQGSSSFENNSAEYGGGIYSDSSNLTVLQQKFCHHARVSPSCINHKVVCNNPSTISGISFLNNTAFQGGAQYFDPYSNFTLHHTACVHFQNNYASEFGGAIYYAADVLGPGQFLSQQYEHFGSECFFRILKYRYQSFDVEASTLAFVNNSAGVRGSVLYGGLLEKCNFTLARNTSALGLFNPSILQVHHEHDVGYSISSDPAQLCFCKMSELSCGEVSQSRSIYPGQQAEVSVVAVD